MLGRMRSVVDVVLLADGLSNVLSSVISPTSVATVAPNRASNSSNVVSVSALGPDAYR